MDHIFPSVSPETSWHSDRMPYNRFLLLVTSTGLAFLQLKGLWMEGVRLIHIKYRVFSIAGGRQESGDGCGLIRKRGDCG